MNEKHVMTRLSRVMSSEALQRVCLDFSSENESWIIKVDVHGLTCRDAKRFVNNIINLTDGGCQVIVIHGYRHGTSIRDMLRNGFKNSHIHHWTASPTNQGITTFVMV